jgi:gamma-glutamyl-gamma-aminobutyrate hydrolase PuuD
VASSASEHAAGGASGTSATAGTVAGRRPLIGLTTYRERAQMLVWDTEFALLHNAYVDSVARAGGVPVLLPPQEHGAEVVIERLDALVLTGGSDVTPKHYRQRPHPHTTIVRPWRDEWELRLLERALAVDLPVLGVCRGAQLLNVALGGTLEQHVPDRLGHQGHCPAPGVFGRTRVALRSGSTLAGVLGAEAKVACYHHQAVGAVAHGLEVTGTSDDGTVEAVELPGRRFVVGVQWHPERSGEDLRLFEALVAAAVKQSEDLARLEVANSGHTIGNARWEAGNGRELGPDAVDAFTETKNVFIATEI